MKTLKITYKDNSTETFEGVTYNYFYEGFLMIECGKDKYTISYNDILKINEL